MRRTNYIFFLLAFLCQPALYAQTSTSGSPVLDSVTIRSYLGKSLLLTAAAVNYVDARQLSRFSNSNILQALNATPGVRMEERSPGSYRLNIRGSAVRSPFGVRNVKIYYDDIPFTAPGGASMLNMLGYYNIGSAEIIKGPGGSMYGAGTGGVLLLQPMAGTQQKINAAVTGGSYGLLGLHASVNLDGNTIRYERLQSDGYRRHTAMQRNNFSWDGQLRTSSKNILKVHFIYSDLFYETPGALTMNEYKNDPRAARPATAVFPGAEQASASIDQQNILLGVSNTVNISTTLKNTTSVYGFYSQLKNPTVQNYEKKKEPHAGARTVFEHSFTTGRSLFTWNAGMEFQSGAFHYRTFKNVGGKPDSLRVEDELSIQQWLAFAQMNWSYKNWMISGGVSFNRQHFDFDRLSSIPAIHETKSYKGTFIPRVAVLYKLSSTVSLYINAAKGFSPPAADEIFADNNSYNLALEPEQGWNYEPGLRGAVFNNRLNFDLSYFTTGLNNSIVTRRDAGGGNYYVNAGKTSQQGFEASLGYILFNKKTSCWHGTGIRGTYSSYRFRYRSFEQSGNDYSGNTMPGVSPNNANLLLDIYTKPGYYLNMTYSYVDKIFLNDANTAWVGHYHLLSLKAGYKKQLKNIHLSVFAGADNLTNIQYSLGNDINGFGGRYYNTAPGRSFYAGAAISL